MSEQQRCDFEGVGSARGSNTLPGVATMGCEGGKGKMVTGEYASARHATPSL